VISPLGGVLGDRIGFRPVLIGALAAGGVVLLGMPFVPSVAALAGLAVVSGAATATVSAMVFGLLALDVPAERRSATLNLVYLPLYAAGIVGPAVGAGVVVATGLSGPFVVAAAIFIIGAIVIAVRPSRDHVRVADQG
jgi:AAHS family 4-hydroxybenzoate transporter-like MFS transporter